MNGFEIKNSEQFKKVYEDEETRSVAVSLLFENIVAANKTACDLKELIASVDEKSDAITTELQTMKTECAIRLEKCKSAATKDKLKSVVAHSITGLDSGIITAIGLISVLWFRFGGK